MKTMFSKTNMSPVACAFADASASSALLSLITDAIIMASVSVIRVIIRVIRSIVRILVLLAETPARSSV